MQIYLITFTFLQQSSQNVDITSIWERMVRVLNAIQRYHKRPTSTADQRNFVKVHETPIFSERYAYSIGKSKRKGLLEVSLSKSTKFSSSSGLSKERIVNFVRQLEYVYLEVYWESHRFALRYFIILFLMAVLFWWNNKAFWFYCYLKVLKVEMHYDEYAMH